MTGLSGQFFFLYLPHGISHPPSRNLECCPQRASEMNGCFQKLILLKVYIATTSGDTSGSSSRRRASLSKFFCFLNVVVLCSASSLYGLRVILSLPGGPLIFVGAWAITKSFYPFSMMSEQPNKVSVLLLLLRDKC